MAVDERFLAGLGSFHDEDAGFSERFVRLTLGGTGTVGVLSGPIGAAKPLGWVLCPAFGAEQIHHLRLETLAARALAAAGFSVLRFHGRGYGDSEARDRPTLTSHLSDARDAVAFLRGAGVDEVGLIGARVGGAVAAMVAVDLGLRHVAMWQPVVDGRRLARDLLWRGAITGLLQPGDAGRPPTGTDGDDIQALDLLAAARAYAGWSLVVAASDTGRLPPFLEETVRELGRSGQGSIQVIRDRYASHFGAPYHRFVDGRPDKADVRLGLDEEIARATAAWASSLHDPGRASP